MTIGRTLVVLTLLAVPLSLFARVQLTYEQLRTYEGVYDYENGLKVTIAASPKDLLLYAIISGARYPLRPHAEDIFLNNQDKQVEFVRDASGEVVGYKQEGEPAGLVHKRLQASIDIPESAWYARVDAKNGRYEYHYSAPEKRDDGLPVGSVDGTGLSPELLTAMVEKVVDDTYPDVHSILIVKDGKLVFEEYFYGYNADTRISSAPPPRVSYRPWSGSPSTKGSSKAAKRRSFRTSRNTSLSPTLRKRNRISGSSTSSRNNRGWIAMTGTGTPRATRTRWVKPTTGFDSFWICPWSTSPARVGAIAPAA